MDRESILPSCCFSHQLIELSSFFSRAPAIYKPEFIFRHEVSFQERKGKDKGQDIYIQSVPVKVQFCSSLSQLPQGGLKKSLLLEEMPRALRRWLLLL